MAVEWVYLAGCLIIGFCAYYGGKMDGLNLGIDHTLTLLDKHKMIDIKDPRFDKIFNKIEVKK